MRNGDGFRRSRAEFSASRGPFRLGCWPIFLWWRVLSRRGAASVDRGGESGQQGGFPLLAMHMNKSLLTNLIAFGVAVTGFLLPEGPAKPFVYFAGLFALSGAVTNWLAVHMLFEKVPGLYGSGVVVARFDEFKQAIFNLVMENFFTEENFAQFADVALHQGVKRETIEQMIDMDAAYDGFLRVVAESKFGGMLNMFGGPKALEPLREPFKARMGDQISSIMEQLDLTKSNLHFETFRPTVEALIKGKLDQLEPQQVKEIVERMIRDHLGWLVVWGGAFGGLIGLAAAGLG